MTYNELKAQVAGLGFERTVSDDDAFFRATERALAIINLDAPQTDIKRIYVRAPRMTRLYKNVCHTGGRTEEYELYGSAFSFRPSGEGEYTVIGGETEELQAFSRASGVVSGAPPSGRGIIRFSGAVDYEITTLASFEGGFASLRDVPEYSEKRAVDLSLLIGDFSHLSSTPICVSGNMAGLELTARGGRLYLPFTLDGEIEIEYCRTPAAPQKNAEALDLPAGTEQLFPLLVASFVWLDDDEGKAQYYMALYRDGINRLKRIEPPSRDRQYKTNGWA